MPKSTAKYCAAFPTAFGPIAALAGEKGLTNILLPSYSMPDLKALLAWEYPQAVADPAHPLLAAFIQQAQAYFAGKPAVFDLEWLDIPSAGSFSGKVYRACWAIPFGKTISYRELALKAGNPDAARAAATMMSKNALPLAIPCHRVIYADGRLGGFSAEGGLELKRKMLTLENAKFRAF